VIADGEERSSLGSEKRSEERPADCFAASGVCCCCCQPDRPVLYREMLRCLPTRYLT